MMKLIDIFRAHPGGVRVLAKSCNIPLHTMYRVGNIQHRRLPVQQLSAVARVLGVSVQKLVDIWNSELAKKSAVKKRRSRVKAAL